MTNITTLDLTTGGETANKRIDWNIEKSHSNDAIIITGLKPDNCNIKEWIIRPIRRKSKVEQKSKTKFKHGDLVKYINIKKKIIIGRITSMRKGNGACKIIDINKKVFGPIHPKSIQLIWRFNKIYFFGEVE